MTTEFSSLVSTGWLNSHLADPGLVILDVRSVDEYRLHIPGATNVPFPDWSVTRGELSLELPDLPDLFKIIGSAGIQANSGVVVVHKTGNPYPLADAARVADTLIYAGVRSVAILDGGQDKWLRENLPLSEVPLRPNPVQFIGNPDSTMFVSRDHVKQQIGQAIILDARGADFYCGANKEASSQRPGHIPRARCLPAPWIWNPDGTYKDIEVLRQMASGIAGLPDVREIIIYCGVGGYTSAWWFVLTQLLGYRNVKFYDGSAQDWARDPTLSMTTFQWE
jgi:thiosulfate/3-mercaptopyruvate sulfurtransferase